MTISKETIDIIKQETGLTLTLTKDEKTKKEFNELCKLIRRKLSYSDIDEEMGAYQLWSKSDKEYKERLFSAANDRVVKQEEEKERKKREAQESIEMLGTAKNFDTLKEQVHLFLLAKDKERARDLIVNFLIDTEYITTEREDNDSVMYIYRDGIYIPHARTYIRELVEKVSGAGYTKNLSNEVISRIEARTYVDSEKLYEVQNPFEVAVQNGILDLKTQGLLPFSPEKFFFSKLPVVYHSGKDCLEIKNFIKQIFFDEEAEFIIQELFGYLIVRNYFVPKAFLFTGIGRNGKSTLLSIMEHYLGKENVSNVPLQVIEKGEYAESELHLKFANIAADLPTETMVNTGKFKELTGGDSISANRKFRSRLKFTSYAKLIFAANQIPSSKDQSDGFFSRWIILDCPNKFYTVEEIAAMAEHEKTNVKVADRQLLSKLTSPEELSGLLNWGLVGLKRLMANGNFTYSKTTNKLKEIYLIKSNSLAAFKEAHCSTTDVSSTTPKEDFRNAYHHFCKQNYVSPRTDKAISKFMSNLGVDDWKSGATRYWQGIKVDYVF